METSIKSRHVAQFSTIALTTLWIRAPVAKTHWLMPSRHPIVNRADLREIPNRFECTLSMDSYLNYLNVIFILMTVKSIHIHTRSRSVGRVKLIGSRPVLTMSRAFSRDRPSASNDINIRGNNYLFNCVNHQFDIPKTWPNPIVVLHVPDKAKHRGSRV